jgi:hypothetical protein
MTMTMRTERLSCVHNPLRPNNSLHSMTTLPHAPHVFRKKGYAPHYNPTNLAQFQPEMHQSALELVNV